MSSRSYLDYVEDVIQAIQKAQAFTAGMDYQAFAADEKTVQEDLPLLRTALLEIKRSDR